MPKLTTLFAGAEHAGGSPSEVFTIQRGSSVWRYTSARESQTVNGNVYLAADVKRGDVEQKQDTGGQQFTVTLALALSAAQALTVDTNEKVTVTLLRTQTAGDPITMALVGTVVQTKFSGDDMELTVATVEREFKRLVPRVRVQPTCPWAFLSPQCGLDPSTYATAATISSVSGQTITVDAVSAQSAVGGWIVLPSGRKLFIAAQDGDDLIVWGRIPDEAVATASVTVYPGCDKTFATCETTFSNAKHFGGFPNLPIRNPAASTLN